MNCGFISKDVVTVKQKALQQPSLKRKCPDTAELYEESVNFEYL